MRLSFVLPVLFAINLAVASDARAECNCVAVAGDVAAAIQAEVAKADGLFARGDFNGALTIYASAYAKSKDAALLYAQGMANWNLGFSDKAKANFEAYLAAGGSLAYRDRAEAALGGISAGVKAGVGTAVGVTGGVVGGVAGGVGAGVGAGAGVVGGIGGEVKPKKIGRKAGIVLGVIAIAAIGAVGIHSIAAGVSADVELDPKFDLGLGIAGVSVGITAIYVAGLTAATGAAAGVPCVTTLPAKKPIVAPVAMPGGGGLAAAMTF